MGLTTLMRSIRSFTWIIIDLNIFSFSLKTGLQSLVSFVGTLLLCYDTRFDPSTYVDTDGFCWWTGNIPLRNLEAYFIDFWSIQVIKHVIGKFYLTNKQSVGNYSFWFLLVFYAAIFWAVTQRPLSLGVRCVTTQKTAVKRTRFS